MKPVRYFHIYERQNGAYSYHPVDSADLKGWRIWNRRLLVWAASMMGLYLCIRKDQPASRTIELDVTTLLPLIHEQLLNCQRDRYQPTRVVVGREQYHQIVAETSMPDYIVSVDIPHGVPLIAGLELVLNPYIDGVVVV